MCGPWPRKKFDAIAASAPTAKPRRGPSATPAAATITVTGCTLGIGAKRTRPAAARPPRVATSVRSRADIVPPSSQAKPATSTATAASSVASPPRAGSSAAHAASASAAAAREPATLDANASAPREACVPESTQSPIRRCAGRSRSWVATSTAFPDAAYSCSQAPSSAFRSGSRPRVGSSRMSRSGSATATDASASRSRSPLERSRGWRPAAHAEPDAVERGASPLFIPVHGERDLLERRLLDEVAARILREVAGATAQLDRPGLRLDQAGGDPRQRGLSGPVRPFERDDLAAAQLEVDPVQNGHGLAVRERDAAKRRHDRARGSLC